MAARIVLAVRESQYIEPLLHYLHHSEYGEMLRITAFSRSDAFAEFMRSEEVPDAVVGDAAFIEAWLVGGRSTVPWAVLSEDGGHGSYLGKNAKNLAGGMVIAKYQSLPALLEAILQLCEIKRLRTPSVAKEDTLLLGIVSCSGSSGKTTIALNIAKQLGGMGLSVFYLNLESVDSSSMFLRPPVGHAPGLERLLYEMQASRSHEEQGIVELGSYIVRHEELQSDAFRPVGNLKEMLQMTRQDTLDLLEQLTAAKVYDVVIIDTGSIEEERARAVLERSTVLLWVMRNDDLSLNKTARWLFHCSAPHSEMPPDILAKSKFAINFGTDSMDRGMLPEGMTLDGLLPHIPSWTLRHREELCLNSPQFQRAIMELCRGIVEPSLPQVFTGKNGNE
jgi:cellulose biosynthesis protein BcsQ